MVASTNPITARFVPPPEPFIAGRWLVPRFTRRDALALVRMGIIPEDASTELLNGLIVLKDRSAVGQDPAMVGKDHSKCVERLSNLRTLINSAARHVESQQPLICTETHVPEPDFVVLRGTLDDYTDVPTAGDAFCVIEVADSSYERDAGEKLAAYARAGVEHYVIVNLRNRTAEVYGAPDVGAGTYAARRIVTVDQVLAIRVGAEEVSDVPLSQILP